MGQSSVRRPEISWNGESAWLTDFRGDLSRIDVPMLVIQGDADRILPIEATGRRLPDALEGSRLVVVEGGSHGISWTHAELINREPRDFMEAGKQPGYRGERAA